MKKAIYLLIVLMFLVSGCTNQNMKKDSVNNTVNVNDESKKRK